jgi:hypothetical protein
MGEGKWMDGKIVREGVNGTTAVRTVRLYRPRSTKVRVACPLCLQVKVAKMLRKRHELRGITKSINHVAIPSMRLPRLSPPSAERAAGSLACCSLPTPET